MKGGRVGKNSAISWTDHTLNTHWGCQKVSPACDSCYAETFAKRLGFDIWGKDAPRRFFGAKHWAEPLKWNEEAGKAGKPARVFCASMADVFEDRRDLDPVRAQLWDLIERTEHLRWMLLTKRADQIARMLPTSWIEKPRHNVWLGVTAENQRRADERIPMLMAVPAEVYWISAEPLLGPVSFEKFPGLDWVIVGGESGHKARRMAPEWARSIRQECLDLGIRYHFKQTGGILSRELGFRNREGKDSSEWPEEFRVQEFPAQA